MSDTTVSRVFRRTCQVAAVAGTNRLEEVLDWLIPVMVYYFGERRWSSADDWFEEIQEAFDIELGLHDISESLIRLVGSGHLIRDSYRDEYRLSKSAAEETERRLVEAENMEKTVSQRWAASLSNNLPEGADPWPILLRYAAAVFRRHGSDALSLLSGDVESAEDEEWSKASVLKGVFDDFGVGDVDRAAYAAAIGDFFTSKDPETIAYITQLADSTFNLMALTVDEDIRSELKARLPQLKIFLDTNILFALMGTHDTPLAAASVDLFRVVSRNDLPFKLYCHARTLRELEHSIEAATSRLTSRNWPKAVSSALIKMSWQATRISGIEMRFHQLNASQPISASAYCARFQSPLALLAEFGVDIFREPDALDNSERMTVRATITEDYKDYLKTHPRRKKSRYETYEHDVIVWMIAKENQLPTRKKGALHSGSFVLSSDYLYWRFDKNVLRKEYGTRAVVVLPDALLQALRPFVGVTHEFDDAAFARLFAAPELRGINGTSYAETVQRVSSYLATFADLQEETALRILTDSILMEKIAKYEESTPEFQEAMERAIFAHNEQLVRQRDELLDERRGQLDIARQALAATDADNMNLVQLLSNLVEELEQPLKSPEVVIIQGGQHMTTIHGGHYENNDNQVVAQGPGAKASGNTISQQHLIIDASDPELANELSRVKIALVQNASSSADFEAVAGVQGAIEAIESGKDDSTILSSLKRAGSRALDIAIELGTKVATKAIEASLGM